MTLQHRREWTASIIQPHAAQTDVDVATETHRDMKQGGEIIITILSDYVIVKSVLNIKKNLQQTADMICGKLYSQTLQIKSNSKVNQSTMFEAQTGFLSGREGMQNI